MVKLQRVSVSVSVSHTSMVVGCSGVIKHIVHLSRVSVKLAHYFSKSSRNAACRCKYRAPYASVPLSAIRFSWSVRLDIIVAAIDLSELSAHRVIQAPKKAATTMNSCLMHRSYVAPGVDYEMLRFEI